LVRCLKYVILRILNPFLVYNFAEHKPISNMKLIKILFFGISSVFFSLGCASVDINPNPNAGNTTTTTSPPTTTTPPTTITPPVTTTPPATTTPPSPSRPEFLPKNFDEKPDCLLSKIILETSTMGNITKTTNTYFYDNYNRFTEIRSSTIGVSGTAVTSYVYKDSEKKIEVSFKGFDASQNYTAVAVLNNDYTINEITINGSSETSKITYIYNLNGEVTSQKFDSNLKSYEVIYTYGSKGIVKSERKNYVAKSSSAPDKEDVLLEWTYGESTSSAYSSLVLSEPNFPMGYLGKLSSSLPIKSRAKTSAKINTPISFEYVSESVTDYIYTNNASNKVIKIETNSSAISSGLSVNVKTKIDLEYK
jgi:hypothetical protein